MIDEEYSRLITWNMLSWNGAMIRYPVVRVPRPRQENMRVPDFVLKCVGFLGDKDAEAEDFIPNATAFLLLLRLGCSTVGTIPML
jgi:hypothetical protein